MYQINSRAKIHNTRAITSASCSACIDRARSLKLTHFPICRERVQGQLVKKPIHSPPPCAHAGPANSWNLPTGSAGSFSPQQISTRWKTSTTLSNTGVSAHSTRIRRQLVMTTPTSISATSSTKPNQNLQTQSPCSQSSGDSTTDQNTKDRSRKRNNNGINIASYFMFFQGDRMRLCITRVLWQLQERHDVTYIIH